MGFFVQSSSLSLCENLKTFCAINSMQGFFLITIPSVLLLILFNKKLLTEYYWFLFKVKNKMEL